MWTQVDGFDVRIRPELIPEHVMEYFAKDVLEAARRFYADPKNREAFEKWKAERDAQEKEGQHIDI